MQGRGAPEDTELKPGISGAHSSLCPDVEASSGVTGGGRPGAAVKGVAPLPAVPPTPQEPAGRRGQGREQGLPSSCGHRGRVRGPSHWPPRSGHRWFSSPLPLLQEKQTSSGPKALFISCLFSLPSPLLEASVLRAALCRGSGWGGCGTVLSLRQFSGKRLGHSWGKQPTSSSQTQPCPT